MKKESPICSSLGLTQLEAAMLIGVHPSLWSMFESGKRNLPTAKMQLVAELLQATAVSKKETTAVVVEKQDPNQKKFFDSLLHENEYQLQTTQRKITAMQKLREAKVNLEAVSDYLNHSNQKKLEDFKMTALQLQTKQAQQAYDWKGLLNLKIKLEVLQFEKKLLESYKIQK